MTPTQTFRSPFASRARRFAATATALATLTAAGACTADDNAVDPQGKTPNDLVEVDGVKIWRSKWDNPVVGSLYELPSGAVEGFAIRNGAGWEYNKFDLELKVDDADGPHRLYTFPTEVGTYGDNEGSFFYESHGMKLEPMVAGNDMSSISTATPMHDTWNQPELVYADALGNTEGRFQLDPDVGLVPLRVVVLHGPGLSAPGFSGPALAPQWMSPKSSALLFDDMWRGAKGKNNTSPFFPDNVVTPFTHVPGSGQVANHPAYGGGRHLQPDRVFDQCDVQFRMVSYHSCEVPAEILYDPNCYGSLAQTGHASSVQSWVEDHCDVPNDVAKVIFLGTLGGSNCFEGKLQGAQLAGDVFITNSFADKKTLSHELGHLLGLGHTSTTDNLMAPGQGVDLSGEQCTKLNAQAKSAQANFWTQSKFSGSWKPPEMPSRDRRQFAAQEFWNTLSRDQLARIERLIGRDHLERAKSTVWRDATAWTAGLPNLEAIALLYNEPLYELLDDRQRRQVDRWLDGR